MFNDSTIQKISIGATIILLLGWSVFKAFWYTSIFGFGASTNVALAVLISLAWEGVNFSLILSSMRDFERGHIRTAIFGMFISVLIGVYDSIEAVDVVKTLAGGHYLFALSTIWAVRFLELRISLLFVDSKKALKQITNAPSAPTAKKELAPTAPTSAHVPMHQHDNNTVPSAPTRRRQSAPRIEVVTPSGTHRLVTLRNVQSTISTYKTKVREAEEKEDYEAASAHQATLSRWQQIAQEVRAASQAAAAR